MITRLPRVALVVHDMDRAIAVFRDGFGMPVLELASAADEVGARLAFCAPPGGSHIELLAPSDPRRPLSRVLFATLDKRGDGPYAMMLNAPDPNAEAEDLESRGMSVMPLMPEAQGRDIHPRETGGVLIRIYPDATNEMIDPALDRAFGPAASRTSAAGLTGIRRVIVGVRDLKAAVLAYRERLGLRTTVGEGRASCEPPAGATIVLVETADGATGIRALVLETRDLDRSVRALRERGIDTDRVGETVEIPPAAACGAPIRLESAA